MTFFAGYSNPRSGGFSEPTAMFICACRAESFAGTVVLTASGRDCVSRAERLATSKLQAKILSLLSGGEAKLLTHLITGYPSSTEKAPLASACGYTNVRSGGFNEPIAHLIELGFVESPDRGWVRASSVLFVGGRR